MTLDPNVDRIAFIRQVSELWRARRDPDPTTRLDYFRELARLAAALETVSAPTDRDLELFRRLIMARPDDMRSRLLGSSLLRLRTLTPTCRRAIQTLSITPDLLSPIGETRYEPSHSRLLAYLMNPRRGSELAPTLLRRFLERIEMPDAALDIAELRRASVTPEAPISHGRVDVRIETADLLVFVEVKIDAGEGPSQFRRYQEALAAQAGRRTASLVLIALAAHEDKPDVVNAALTFRDLLIAWLPFAAPDDAEAGYLARYLKTVALLLESTGTGAFEDWTFSEQRAALDLVDDLAIETEP